MRIVIDLLIAEQQSRSTALNSIREMISKTARCTQEHEYILVTSKPKEYRKGINMLNVQIYPLKLNPKYGILMQHQMRFPGVLNRFQPDLLHVPDGIAPVGWHGPLIISLHDTSWLLGQDPLVPTHTHHYRRYLLRESMQRAHAIIISSEQIYTLFVSTWAIERPYVHLVQKEEIIPQIYQMAYARTIH